jgi:hypothetical protein
MIAAIKIRVNPSGNSLHLARSPQAGDRDLLEVVGEHPRGQQAGKAAADHDRVAAELVAGAATGPAWSHPVPQHTA